MKLYELTGKYAELQALIEDGDSEAVADTLESLEGAIEEKVDAIHRVHQNLQSDIDALKAEEKRLQERRRTLENEQKRLKEYTEEQLQKAGIKKVKTVIGTVSLRKSPPSVEILDAKLIPEEFLTYQEPRVNRRELLKAFNDMDETEQIGFRVISDKTTIQFR